MLRRRVLLLTAGCPALSACGFELRRAPDMSFSTIALSGFAPRSPLAEALRRELAMSPGTRVVDAPPAAQVVLEALTDVREKSVAASTAAGQVRELNLRTRLRFRLHTPSGRELIPATEIALSRDLSYSETAALAKEQEEALLFRAMDADIVQQVLRRLAAVRSLG